MVGSVGARASVERQDHVVAEPALGERLRPAQAHFFLDRPGEGDAGIERSRGRVLGRPQYEGATDPIIDGAAVEARPRHHPRLLHEGHGVQRRHPELPRRRRVVGAQVDRQRGGRGTRAAAQVRRGRTDHRRERARAACAPPRVGRRASGRRWCPPSRSAPGRRRRCPTRPARSRPCGRRSAGAGPRSPRVRVRLPMASSCSGPRARTCARTCSRTRLFVSGDARDPEQGVEVGGEGQRVHKTSGPGAK